MLKTFRFGGIHPKASKGLSEGKPLERMPMPKVLRIPLAMSAGKPAKPMVKVGDEVFTGMLIALKDGFVSANVHSPADGTVKSFEKVLLPTGTVCDAVVVETRPQQAQPFCERKRNVADLTAGEILKIVEESGIVGMGGAAFPASVKYAVKEGAKVEYVLVNACECEPYLTCDHRLLLERQEAIADGIRILKRLFAGSDARLCVEDNKRAAAEGVMRCATDGEFSLEILKTKYPQGDEKSIINAVTGREVPSGKLPLDVGCVVVNLGTCVALFEAVCYGKPLYERALTVTGEAVGEPKNLICPVGTPVRDVLEFCSGLSDDASKVISGGPMMGFSFYDLDTPVMKATSGILVLPKMAEKEQYPCISCGRCAAACPMRLVPTEMYKLITKGMIAKAIEINLLDCRECGCCEYSCPSGIPLVQGFKMGKKAWRMKA